MLILFFRLINQYMLGACTAHAGAGAMQFCYLRDQVLVNQKNPSSTFTLITWMPSRLGIYFFERKDDTTGGGPTVDSGASMADLINTLIKYPVFPETYWPYTDQYSLDFLLSPFGNQPTLAPFMQDPTLNIPKKRYCNALTL